MGQGRNDYVTFESDRLDNIADTGSGSRS